MRRQRRREQHVRTTYNATASHYEQTDDGRLEVETPTERTHKTQQAAIAGATSANAAANAWRKDLPKGPYGVNVARTGRHAVVYGAGGRVEVLDLHRNIRLAEVRCGEVCKAATFLHDETMVAVAQRKYVYVYDETGAEVHRMAKHLEPEHLQYLPFHFLLASAGHAGWLKYADVSTGQFIAEHNTRMGVPRSLAQNPQTAVLCMGHGNGVCSLWSPAQAKPLARLLCHRGAVDAVACGFDGTYLATGGVDGCVKVWDCRTFRAVTEMQLKGRAPVSLAFSQTGMLAVTTSRSVEIYENASKKLKAFAPYLSHKLDGTQATNSIFRPFEDVLLCGHALGADSILVPGAGEASYDAVDGEDPYRSKKGRKAAVVRGLLDKLPLETITLQGAGFVGTVERDAKAAEKERHTLESEANAGLAKKIKEKKKTRGRSKLKAKLKKRTKNVISRETNLLKEKVASLKRRRGDAASASTAEAAPTTALDRLFARSRRPPATR